jgi:hypothetical protein
MVWCVSYGEPVSGIPSEQITYSILAMNAKETFLYIIGILLFVFGLVMILGSIIQIDKGEKSLGSTIALSLGFGVLPTVAGLQICRRMKASARQRKIEREEHAIMLLATQHNGKLTPAELAMHTDMSVAQAQRLLEQYTIQGITSIGISESGARVFHFHELISDDEKDRAEEL